MVRKEMEIGGWVVIDGGLRTRMVKNEIEMGDGW